MTLFKKSYEIKTRDFIHAGEASINVQSTLKSIGYDPGLVRRAAVCAYESEMNVVMHGGPGTLTLTVDTDQIVIEVLDSGPGIENIELAFQEGYSTAPAEFREMGFGAGMGLPNIKKNADQVDVQSEKGKGTCVRMIFRVAGHD